MYDAQLSSTLASTHSSVTLPNGLTLFCDAVLFPPSHPLKSSESAERSTDFKDLPYHSQIQDRQGAKHV